VPGKPVSEDPDEWIFSTVETGLAAHHRLLLEKLQLVFEGEIQRLMIFMPPGSAKSTYASVVFPSWAMGRTPGLQIILASYGSDLARKHGRRTRQVVKSKRYKEIFNTEILQDNRAADEWALDNGSEYMAGGILSGLTGNRADGIITDDPVKGRQEADSEATQRNVKAAYDDDLKTRLKPGGWEIIIQTRWNERDLSGQILPEDYSGESGWIDCRDGQKWYVLCLPAICDTEGDPLGRELGDILWPEWFTKEHFARFQNNPRTWSALYQQRPQPDEGTYFQRDWFHWYEPDNPPKHLRNYGASDYAVTEDGGDYTEHGIFGVDPDEDIYILDWWWGQTAADEWIDAKCALIQEHRPLLWGGEAGVIRKSVEPFMIKRMRELKAYCRIEWVPSVRDKPTRARGFQARASMGKVYLPNNEAGHRLLDQLLRFPAGAYDDAVDVCSLFGQLLDQTIPGMVDKAIPEVETDVWGRKRKEEGSWKTA